ncbi:MAG: tRNA lysidine(34) synthetase TilS [Candidatus Gracilibacteria bacterium]|jgi:tRNA(Ile)-lysidine synthase|nr:tRNA lysidine(34) synthetase TilS [Candidatus Gracilibacteria bacterium]
MHKKIIQKLNRLFSFDDQVFLACSGGADSVFLLEMLHLAGFKNVTVLHFNHNLRGDLSDGDEDFVAELSSHCGFGFVSEKWQKPSKSEEDCRKARFDFFDRNRSNKPLLLAHHADDDVETCFFNFLRGTGLRGLSGISEIDLRRQFYRPLLDVSKAEILEYMESNQLMYRDDASNFESEYARNYLRNEIFPLIEKKFPYFKGSVKRQKSIYQDVEDFLAIEAGCFIDGGNEFSRSDFARLHKALQRAVVRGIFDVNLDAKNVDDLIDFIGNGVSNKKMIIKNRQILIFGDNFFFSKL